MGVYYDCNKDYEYKGIKFRAYTQSFTKTIGSGADIGVIDKIKGEYVYEKENIKFIRIVTYNVYIFIFYKFSRSMATRL